jgi:hypothetical protein
MEDSISRPSGPQTYAALIEQAPDVVMGNPLIYGILVDAMHQGIEQFYASREEAFRQAKDAEAEGKMHIIQPELMKQTIEDCYALLNIAKDVADWKYPKSEAHVVEDEDGKEHLIIDFRTLLNRTLLEESK